MCRETEWLRLSGMKLFCKIFTIIMQRSKTGKRNWPCKESWCVSSCKSRWHGNKPLRNRRRSKNVTSSKSMLQRLNKKTLWMKITKRHATKLWKAARRTSVNNLRSWTSAATRRPSDWSKQRYRKEWRLKTRLKQLNRLKSDREKRKDLD